MFYLVLSVTGFPVHYNQACKKAEKDVEIIEDGAPQYDKDPQDRGINREPVQ